MKSDDKSQFMFNVSPSLNIYRQAQSFHRAANILHDRYNNTFEPSLMCISFAIELYLKSLQAERHCKYRLPLTDGGTSHNDIFDKTLLKGGHNLLTLYNSLPDSIRGNMNLVYKSSRLTAIYPEITDALDIVKDVFIHFRYEYEKHTYCVAESTCFKLADFICQFIENLLSDQQTAEAK